VYQDSVKKGKDILVLNYRVYYPEEYWSAGTPVVTLYEICRIHLSSDMSGYKEMRLIFSIQHLSARNMLLPIGLSIIAVFGTLQASQDDEPAAAEAEMMSSYELAMANGDETAAVRHVLDYTEKAYGENSPETVKLTHRYGALLYQDGEYREATEVLIKALQRSTAVYGESGGEAFELNMNIGYAYSRWRKGLSERTRYFNRALEILRERGEYESVGYVGTLLSIAINLMDNGGLKGDYSSHFSDTIQSPEVDEYAFPIENEYSNYYYRAEKYILEAIEIGKKLEDQDEYITSKIDIAYAKLKVLETADLAAVPMGTLGYISGGTESDYYDREQERLMAAIENLSRDTDTNRIFLNAANSVLMDIAWLDKDEKRMMAMCSAGMLNSAGEYPPDRLYEIMQGGMVFAPDIGIRVSTNIFRPLRSRGKKQTDKDGNPVRKPYFIPVCVDGRLMAALIHAPRVTVEEIR
jgi:tetratricopeptide (TPR) repeat protein